MRKIRKFHVSLAVVKVNIALEKEMFIEAEI